MNDEQGILRRLDHYADCIEKGVHVTGTQLKSLVKDIRESGLISSQQPAAVDGADRDDARRYRALVSTGKYVPAMQGWGLACSRSKASKAELDAAADALAAQQGGRHD